MKSSTSLDLDTDPQEVVGGVVRGLQPEEQVIFLNEAQLDVTICSSRSSTGLTTSLQWRTYAKRGHVSWAKLEKREDVPRETRLPASRTSCETLGLRSGLGYNARKSNADLAELVL